MNHVMDVRRRDTFEVQRNLQAIEQQKEELVKEVELLRNENLNRDLLLQHYQDMFGTV